MAVIIIMSIVLGAELGPKVDPTTTTYTPRPEWYFFFLFELLRVIKPPSLVPLATIGDPDDLHDPAVPAAVLRPQPRAPAGAPADRDARRASSTIIAMGYLTYLGAVGRAADADRHRGRRRTSSTRARRPSRRSRPAQQVVAQSGCAACHKFGENGNDGPGPELTEIGARLPAPAIERTLLNPTAADAVVRAACSRASPQQFDEMVHVPVRRSSSSGRSRQPAMPDGPASGTLDEPQVRAMFDRIAGVYDRHELGHDRGPAPPWRRRAADLAQVGAGRRRARRRHRHRRPRDRARRPRRRRRLA